MASKEHDGSGPAAIAADGRLRDVAWRGLDFRPESRHEVVLAAMTDAVRGLPVDTEPAALAARLRAAIPFGVELIGTTTRELANAIHGSLGTTTPTIRIGSFTPDTIDGLTRAWREYDWRLIPERPLSAAMNVALDEILNESDRPSLRFWNWAEPAVVIGRCQSIANEVDRDAMAARGVALVRRSSGGGAMFAQPHGTITWSITLPEEAVAGLTIRQSYEVCDAWAIQCLRGLGADAHHVPVNDIACAEGKIAGAAQARRKGRVLHHTTLAYDLDMGELATVLRIGRERPAESAVASAAKVVAPLRSQLALPRSTVVESLLHSFRECYGGRIEPLTASELAAAAELARSKYADPVWTESFA